ncbi:MAG: AAA family ATPase [Actinomycetota bacterium]|nr:AAA family ATPase [Actinomycetota bacterium]
MNRPPEFIGLAYTGDVDEVVARCDPVLGFGCFEIPVSGTLTALVGKNGTGKTRFLKSIGIQSELLYKMAPPAADIGGRQLGEPLWNLAEASREEDEWFAPNANSQGGVDGFWSESPRSRAHTLSEFNNADRDWSAFFLPGETLTEPTEAKYLFPTATGQRFAHHLWANSARAQQLQPSWLEKLAPLAATAMYTAWNGNVVSPMAADWEWREKLFMLAVGREIAEQCVISLTGATHGSTQRLRFWFEADAARTPALSLLMIGCQRALPDGLYRHDLGDAIRGDGDDEDPTLSQPEFIQENFGSVVYANGDAGLVTHPGSTRHFTPLLPLALYSFAAVLHADDEHALFLEGDSVLASTQQRAPHGGVQPPEPTSWHGAAELGGSFDMFADVELDGPRINLTAGLTRRREATEEAWRDSLLLGRSTTNPWNMTVQIEEQQFLNVFVRIVNRVSHLLMEDPPTACIDISTGRVEWRFIKLGPAPNSRGDTLALDQLSLAERRWCAFANLLTSRFFLNAVNALGEPDDQEWASSALVTHPADPFGHTPTIVTIDEPEAGLHPTAIRHLSQGLEQLGDALHVHFVVATHSPHVLRTVRRASGTVAHAHVNSRGQTIFEAVDPSELDSLASLIGMHQEDILQMTSTFVFVEGEHDKVVLEAVLEDSLAQAGAVIVPMRGADDSHQIVDSAILWRFHEGRIVVVLDSLNTERITTALTEAQVLLREGARDEALAVIETLKTGSTDEGTRELGALHELFVHAVLSDRLQRLEVFSLAKPDIINYFHPVELGAPPDNSDFGSATLEEIWPELVKRHRNAPRKNRPGFKTWALLQLGISGDVTSVLSNAARNLDRIPSDFDDLRRLVLNRP